jgi:hypothetical protein
MNQSEAKNIMGIPANSHLLPNEINKYYREMAKKLHPDIGGNHSDMVALNEAKEVLMRDENIHQKPKIYWEQREVPKQEINYTLDEAIKNSNVPGNIEWMFVTNLKSKPISVDISSSVQVWYGRTKNEHIFLGTEHIYGENYYQSISQNTWVCHLQTVPASENLSDIALSEIKNIFNKFRCTYKVSNSEKTKILPSGFELNINTVYDCGGKGTTLKDAIYNATNKIENKLTASIIYITVPTTRIIIDINGRKFVLNKTNTKMMTSNHNEILHSIMNKRNIHHGSETNITKSNNGKIILIALARDLVDEPEELIELLNKAANQLNKVRQNNV